MRDITKNNFDLIRLAAALQVAVLHVTHSVSPEWSSSQWARLLEIYPGVPIFFFISGFLISRSFERSSSLGNYTKNRALRIFPGLHVCVALNILAVTATGYFQTNGTTFLDLFALYVAKTTFFQFYNPDFMRRFGDGVLNGSLWTICVELQFYVLTPFIYRFIIDKVGRRAGLALLAMIALSILANRLLYGAREEYAETVCWKLLRVSFLPWVYMFLTGVLAQRHFNDIQKILSFRFFPLFLVSYTLLATALYHHGFSMDNSFSPILFFPLCCLVLAAAYGPSRYTADLLKGQDISYGIYIYHVPVMNMFVFYGLTGSMFRTAEVIALTLALGLASWLLIERPSLRKKRAALRPAA